MYAWVRRILTQYSLRVFIGQADTDRIFIECMHGSGGFQYSLGVCMGQADTDPIFIACIHRSGGYRSDIHWVYAWVRRILTQYSLCVFIGQADTDRIFIERMQGSGGLLIQYSLGVCRGQADY